ncbi:MAG: sensor histidine kinase N-terminal domain-containing protein [Amaricoccus sp.]
MSSIDLGGGPVETGPPPRSLARRLTFAVILVLAFGALAVALAAFAYGRRAAEQTYDRLLIGAANQIAEAVRIRDGAVAVDLPVSAFQLLALAPRDRILYGVFGPDGQTVTGYPVARPRPDARSFFTGAFGGEAARFAVVRRAFAERDFEGTVTVSVGQTLQARRELARQIATSAVAVSAAIGLAMAALAAFAVRSALAPLRAIEQAVARRAAEDLTPLDVAVPSEIRGLVKAINHLMARFERHLEATRTLIGDASHQLRTPIAALRAQAELAADETDPERQRTIVARLRERATGLGRLTDQMLSHAMIIHRTDAAPRRPLDLRLAAMRAVAEMDEATADADRLRLDLPEEPVPCLADELSLVEACKNLASNALRDGAPPVTIGADAQGGRARLWVRDRGPGIPREHWADSGARYHRTTGVTPTSAGLGLAIANAVARAHHGRLRFSKTAEGEFEAAIVLPAGTPA